MPWITIEEARENLTMWLDAERAISTSQSYKIGTRSLSRADLSLVASRIAFWRNEIEKLENGQRGLRVVRAVPRDF